CRGRRIAARGASEGRRPLHQVRPLRDSLPDRRHHDGALHDHRTLRGVIMSSKSNESETSSTAAPDRREFLLRVGAGAGIAAIVYQGVASLRSLVPNVSYDAPTTVKLGNPSEFPDGLKFLPDQRLFVFRDGATFHAISAVCTHLGCTARAE